MCFLAIASVPILNAFIKFPGIDNVSLECLCIVKSLFLYYVGLSYSKMNISFSYSNIVDGLS